MKIGFFDSGIGGIDLYRDFQAQHPAVEVDYISDLAFCPYGEKTPEQIQERAHLLTRTLLARGAQMIVIACNTATAHAIDGVRQDFAVPFVGVEPYINFIKLHRQEHPSALFRPVVLLTQAMAQSRRFALLQEKILGPDYPNQVTVFPCPGLADLIEYHWSHRHQSSLFKQELAKILAPLTTLKLTHGILGCTHYPLIHREIEELLQLKCISPGPFIINRIAELMKTLTPPLSATGPTLDLRFHPITPVFQAAVTQDDPHFLDKIHSILHRSTGPGTSEASKKSQSADKA